MGYDKWKEHEKKFLPYCLFKQLKKTVLEKIDNIRSQECSLFSRKYRVAGRVDCIAEYDGKLSIIDFKTSTKERTDEYNENYYIQALHMQRCLKNKLEHLSNRLLFWS